MFEVNMDLVDKIIDQARNVLVCPICNKQYEQEELRFRGFIDNTYIFQAFCAKNHQPMVVTYLASLHRLEKPIGAYFHTVTGEKISKNIADRAEKLIDGFGGDFQSLWPEN